jgi:hypothetical protein
MKKTLFLTIFGLTCLFVFIECFNQSPKVVEKKPNPQLITHKEAVDTMRADTNAPLKALVFKKMNNRESYEFCKNNDLSCYLKSNYPNNGFFGKDNYRIEFIINDVKRDSFNVNIYHVKGKNRHKNIITNFTGEVKLLGVSTFSDPNLDSIAYHNMNIEELYALTGEFTLREDATSKYSGTFQGKFTSELMKTRETDPQYCRHESWFYSENLPSQGAGYRYEGTWTSYNDTNDTKSVLWASDFFRIANNILKDFSYGEREVNINPEYRNLGWQELWEENEWWAETPKKEL